MIEDVVDQTLRPLRYDPTTAPQVAKDLASNISNRITSFPPAPLSEDEKKRGVPPSTVVGFPRYKHVVQVTIGELKDQGLARGCLVSYMSHQAPARLPPRHPHCLKMSLVPQAGQLCLLPLPERLPRLVLFEELPCSFSLAFWSFAAVCRPPVGFLRSLAAPSPWGGSGSFAAVRWLTGFRCRGAGWGRWTELRSGACSPVLPARFFLRVAGKPICHRDGICLLLRVTAVPGAVCVEVVFVFPVRGLFSTELSRRFSVQCTLKGRECGKEEGPESCAVLFCGGFCIE